MKTAVVLVLIVSGIVSAIVSGFYSHTTFSLAYDDEQEKIKEQRVIKISHVVSEITPKGRAARRFKELVERRTNGEVKVEIYPNGSLYSDISEWNALKNNNVQMIMPATSKVSEYIPEFQVFDLPFAFRTHEEVEAAYSGVIGNILLDKLESQEGVRGLTFWYNGFKQITNSKKPLVYPKDFKHLHFRTMPGDLIEDQYQLLGAAVSSLPFNKTYENLQVGFIDGQENTISNIYSKKLYENQQFLTVSNHAYLGYVVLMNKDFWSDLSPEHKMAVEDALAETTDWIRRHSIEINDSHMREIKRDNLLEIHTLLNVEKEKWKEELEPLYQQYEPVIGRQIMDEVRAIQGEQ
ncbi:DctP family TRAP transporter solute-binding subunit [Bacillus sp. SCS-153A]|uniref:DctP family TRAP transporter solute-binding subunit n=1 Tax=Rossellomorea sedimentorum TaxID=3115294 RepID=UPI00390590C2